MSFPTTPGSLRGARPWIPALLAAAALALSGALATTGVQAKQGPDPLDGEDETIAVKGGYAEFRHEGDVLEVNDGVLDGRGVRAEFGGEASADVPDDIELSDYKANGHPVKRSLSLPERAWVVLRVCYTVDHERDQCSDWQRAAT